MSEEGAAVPPSWTIAKQGIRVVLFVLGLFSGYLRTIAPISDETSKLAPGGIASFSALIILLAFWLVARWIPSQKRRMTYWLVLALAASCLAVWSINRYPPLLYQGTVQVPIGPDLKLIRRVKGTEFTDEANAYLRGFPNIDKSDDDALIRARGGIKKVWTKASIQEQWRRLTREYVVCVVSVILALSCLVEAFPGKSSPARPASHAGVTASQAQAGRSHPTTKGARKQSGGKRGKRRPRSP